MLLTFRGLRSLLVLAGTAGALYGASSDWSRFRGPNGSGVPISTERGIPVEFSPAKNVVWKTSLPGGNSSPVFGNESIFVTGFEGDELFTIAMERETGRVQWRRTVTREREGELREPNNPAAPSPVTDGENVYVFFQDFGMLSYGPDGNERWRIPLGPFNNPMGMGASPILSGGKVILVCDSETDSFMIAVDKDTGKIAWRNERDFVTRGFSTPVLYDPKDGSGQQVIVAGSYQLIAYSVATGEKVWWVRGLTWQLKPTPVMDDDTIYVLCWAGRADLGEQEDVPPFEEVLPKHDQDGDGLLSEDELPDPDMKKQWSSLDLDHDGFLGPRDWMHHRGKRASVNAVNAIRLGGKGDMTDSAFRWRYYKSLPNVPSPLLYDGVLYLVKDGGIVTTLDAQTGEVLKQGRLREAMDRYFTAPVAVDGKVLMISEMGKASVLKPGADWDVIQVNDMGEEVWATPAIVDGKLYVRTKTALYCFDEGD